MLKLAKPEDSEDLKRMSLSFFHESPYAKYGVSEERIDNIIQDFTKTDTTKLCLLSMEGDKAVGVLAAIAAPNLYNFRQGCFEVIWWVDPPYRTYKRTYEIIEAYVYWGRNIVKAQTIQLVTLSPKLHKLYTKLGFSKAEEAYIQEL